MDSRGEAGGVTHDGVRGHQGAAAHVRAVDLQAGHPGPHAGGLHQPPAVTGVHGGTATRQRWNQGPPGVGQRSGEMDEVEKQKSKNSPA